MNLAYGCTRQILSQSVGAMANPSSFWKASSSSPRCQLLALASAKRVTQLQSWCFDLSLATWRHECRSYICALHIQGGSAHCTGHTNAGKHTKTQSQKHKHANTNTKTQTRKDYHTKTQSHKDEHKIQIHTYTQTQRHKHKHKPTKSTKPQKNKPEKTKTQTQKNTHKQAKTQTLKNRHPQKRKHTNTQKHNNKPTKHITSNTNTKSRKHKHIGLAWPKEKSSECIGGLNFRARAWSSFLAITPQVQQHLRAPTNESKRPEKTVMSTWLPMQEPECLRLSHPISSPDKSSTSCCLTLCMRCIYAGNPPTKKRNRSESSQSSQSSLLPYMVRSGKASNIHWPFTKCNAHAVNVNVADLSWHNLHIAQWSGGA